MKAPHDSEIGEFFKDLRAEDPKFAAEADRLGPLADFVNDYDFAKETLNLTQRDLAKHAGTTQSAVSRFEAMKHPPTYDLLVRISGALGDKLFLSPFGSLSLSLPYDLHEKAKASAARHGITVRRLMAGYVREGLNRDGFEVLNRGSMTITEPNSGCEFGESADWDCGTITSTVPSMTEDDTELAG